MENFYKDVIAKDNRFHSTKPISDIALLEPIMRAKVQQIIADAAGQGIKLMVYETYRSQERQQLLFDQKASLLKTVGVHHYGLACDLVKDIDGHPSWKGDFKFMQKLAKKNGLIWGGDWGKPSVKPKLYDAVHVQRCTVARQKALFNGTWYPDDNYDPYK
jgi:hypothetical protein